MKVAFLNDRYLPAAKAQISISDRGFLYGDALFETIRVYGGQPFSFAAHIRRLQEAARFLGLKVPISAAKLLPIASLLLRKNSATEGVLRIQLSRGAGERGYSPKGANHPTLLMSVHPAPNVSFDVTKIRLKLSKWRVASDDPLSRIKSCNKLRQVLARAEADDAGYDDALLLNERGQLTESTTANLFWIEKQTVCTPPVDAGILPGITRAAIIDLCRKLSVRFVERSATPDQLRHADGAFLTSSVMEILEVTELDHRKLKTSPITAKLAAEYAKLARDVQ